MLVQSHFIGFHWENFLGDKREGNLVSGSFDYAVYFYDHTRLIFENNSFLCQVINVTFYSYSATEYTVRQCIINLKSTNFKI